ncbi:hypothetical protein [Amycolatopsis saalfeldensis]|uniref:Uncharacterized protein n=1 Tax=Amycolatopsis saalfeldensis TaxID=394193 RepID=A0A1H8VUF8_9PSEU|nr:hypothetical protein [Amycolatopsis saalfeldensis]SEP18940.1 hypothetical protein SAMN04489732_104297 [Amycolatopsis saalfeldensis]
MALSEVDRRSRAPSSAGRSSIACSPSWLPLDRRLRTAETSADRARAGDQDFGYLLRNAVVGDRWARKLHETYEARLDEVEAAALTGAVQAALEANLDQAGRPRVRAGAGHRARFLPTE